MEIFKKTHKHGQMSLTCRENLVIFYNRKILQKKDYPLLDKYIFPRHCSAFYIACLEKCNAIFSSQYFSHFLIFFFLKRDIYLFGISILIIAKFQIPCQFSILIYPCLSPKRNIFSVFRKQKHTFKEHYARANSSY